MHPETMTYADNESGPVVNGSMGPSWHDEPTTTIALFSKLRSSYGRQTTLSWRAFVALCGKRRQGEKDGPNFVPATFQPELNGQVHRLASNLVRRNVIVIDIETSKATGEVPPPLGEVAARIEVLGWAGVCYTSHNHEPSHPRYRIALPLNQPIPHPLPAVEVIAFQLGVAGVLDATKLGAASVFFLPSSQLGQLAQHETVEIGGEPVNAEWLQTEAGVLLAQREAERAKQLATAMEAAVKRREKQIAQGRDPNASIIEPYGTAWILRLSFCATATPEPVIGLRTTGDTSTRALRRASPGSVSCAVGMALIGCSASTPEIR